MRLSSEGHEILSLRKNISSKKRIRFCCSTTGEVLKCFQKLIGKGAGRESWEARRRSCWFSITVASRLNSRFLQGRGVLREDIQAHVLEPSPHISVEYCAFGRGSEEEKYELGGASRTSVILPEPMAGLGADCRQPRNDPQTKKSSSFKIDYDSGQIQWVGSTSETRL